MSSTLKLVRSYPGSPDGLVRLLTDPDYLVARQKVRGALEATVREVRHQGGKLVQEVEVLEHAHTPTGIDRSRTERGTTFYEWNLEARSCRWEYRGPHERIRVEGSVRVEPHPEGASMLVEFVVAARMPLIGGMIEKKVIKELENGQAQVDALINERLPRTGGGG